MAGIKKVDEVLGECVGGECEDSDDVKSWLQLKRAQLLKIVVSDLHMLTQIHSHSHALTHSVTHTHTQTHTH